MPRVYLDHNAGAPLRATAAAAMTSAMAEAANPSSAHREGARARRLLEEARARVAALVGAAPAEVVLTSGATEATNLALRALLGPGDLLVTSAIEHASVLATADDLERAGVRVRRLGVGRDGRLHAAELAAACAARPRLVSLALANGEIGTAYPLAALVAEARAHGALVHTDAAQAAGRLAIDVRALGVDLLSLSSPKLGGPAGMGALYVRRGLALRSVNTGGPQERGRRGGTENLLGAVGFGAAAVEAAAELPEAPARMQALRDRLWEELVCSVPGIVRNGPCGEPSLPNTLNVSIPDIAGESLLVRLDLAGVAASLGSACAAGSPEPSHVLLAMGVDPEHARAGLRLSLGSRTTAAEVAFAAEAIAREAATIRGERAA